MNVSREIKLGYRATVRVLTVMATVNPLTSNSSAILR